MIHTQRQKPRANRSETRNPQTRLLTGLHRHNPTRSLDSDTPKGLLDRRTNLRRRQATRDKQTANRAILMRRHRQRNPWSRTKQPPRQTTRQRPQKRLKRGTRDSLTETQLPPATRCRQPISTPHAPHQHHERDDNEHPHREPHPPEHNTKPAQHPPEQEMPDRPERLHIPWAIRPQRVRVRRRERPAVECVTVAHVTPPNRRLRRE
jgi:hypothetical protein